MELNEYQQKALRTATRARESYPQVIQDAARALEATGGSSAALLQMFDQLIWCLGLAGEVGEALDMVKKHLGHGHPLDSGQLLKEFGDFRWYGAVLENSFGFTSSEVAWANVTKLCARYPEGFSTAASLARADEGGER